MMDLGAGGRDPTTARLVEEKQRQVPAVVDKAKTVEDQQEEEEEEHQKEEEEEEEEKGEEEEEKEREREGGEEEWGEEFVLDVDEDGRICGADGTAAPRLNYTLRVCEGFLPAQHCDAVRRECLRLHAMGSKALDASFFVSAEDMPQHQQHDAPQQQQPQQQSHSLLEELATAVFHYHTVGCVYDPEKSGAEFWFQVRHPADEDVVAAAGLRIVKPLKNEATHGKDEMDLEMEMEAEAKEGEDVEECMVGEDIQFHFDKDEVMAAGLGMWLHPHLSTVTYLTDHGAPTAVLPMLSRMHTGEGPSSFAHTLVLSHPVPGKHLVFDGRLLHGCPAIATKGGSAVTSSSNPRVTFLVNIWLNHMPLGIERLPDIPRNNLVSHQATSKGGANSVDAEEETAIPASELLLHLRDLIAAATGEGAGGARVRQPEHVVGPVDCLSLQDPIASAGASEEPMCATNLEYPVGGLPDDYMLTVPVLPLPRPSLPSTYTVVFAEQCCPSLQRLPAGTAIPAGPPALKRSRCSAAEGGP